MHAFWTAVAFSGLTTAVPALAQDHHAAQAAASKVAEAQRVQINVTADGFVPVLTKVKAGQPVTLIVTRKVERTCATEIVIKEHGISKPLPLNKAVEVTFTPKKPGKTRFACAMDMIAGEVVAE